MCCIVLIAAPRTYPDVNFESPHRDAIFLIIPQIVVLNLLNDDDLWLLESFWPGIYLNKISAHSLLLCSIIILF